MADYHKNFASSTITGTSSANGSNPGTSGTAITVSTGDGTKFPAAPFNVTVWPANTSPTSANAEIVRVTAISTDTFTVTRTQESSTNQNIQNGWQIAATITAKALTDIEDMPSFQIGSLGVVGHSWTAGAALSSTGTPQFEEEGVVGRLAGMLKIANENIEHLGIAGTYLCRTASSVTGASFGGWGGVFGLVYPNTNPNIADTSTSIRAVPTVGTPKAWMILHGINDASAYGNSLTTNTTFTQTAASYGNALRAVISRLRAGALYSSYRDSSGNIAWDSSITFGGSGSWSDQATVGANTGPAYKSNGTNSGTVTITIPANFTGGTVALAFLGQRWAHAFITNAGGINNSATSISISGAYATDFPSSGNFIVQIESEQVLVTSGGGTSTWTVTRGYNGTSAASHAQNTDCILTSGLRVDFTVNGVSSGSLNLGAQGAGAAGATNVSDIALVKRFTLTAANAGQNIVATTAGIVTTGSSETYARTQFDSWWIEASTPPLVAVNNVPIIAYGGGYVLAPSRWSTLNSTISTVVAEFDSSVAIADLYTAWLPHTATLRSSVADGTTTTVSVTANDATTWTNMGTRWVATCEGEDMLVTANTNVGGSNFDLTVTRGYNGTSAAAHTTTGVIVSDQSWMHTDNIHPNAYGHAVNAKVFYDTFKHMTPTDTYALAFTNGNVTQDNHKISLGIKDNYYMIHNISGALANTTTFTKNKLWYWPFYVSQKSILIGGGIATGGTTAGTATSVRVGIYDLGPDRYFPGYLIKEFGTGATTATNALVEVNCFQVLYPGWYFLAYVNQGTTAGTVKTVSATTATMPMPFHMESSHPAGSGATSFSPFYSDTGTISSNLPSQASAQMDAGPCPFPVLHFRAKHYG